MDYEILIRIRTVTLQRQSVRAGVNVALVKRLNGSVPATRENIPAARTIAQTPYLSTVLGLANVNAVKAGSHVEVGDEGCVLLNELKTCFWLAAHKAVNGMPGGIPVIQNLHLQ